MNQMQVFNNSEFGELGVITIDGKEHFPATACAKTLGYSNPHKAILDHCKNDGVTKREVIDSMGRAQSMKFITEGNLYRLIVKSRLPSAERFETWVFDEILPEIRKSGTYIPEMSGFTKLVEQFTQALTALSGIVTKLYERETAVPAEGLLMTDTFELCTANKCKLETFPPQVVNQVDDMLINMMNQQALNFSMIARYCTVNGYPISSPSVKRYYLRHIAEDDN